MKKLFRAASVVFSTLLASNASSLEVGDIAPDFTVQSTKGDITLSEELKRGPVVLALYYADFTPG